MTKFSAVLGASDPEMSATAGLLAEAGIPHTWAVCNGTRVHPGNAYRADGVEDPSVLEGTDATLVVESRFADRETTLRIAGYHGDRTAPDRQLLYLDHHREGDAGYGIPPSRFLEGSSLGQAISALAPYGLPEGFRPVTPYLIVGCEGIVGSFAFTEDRGWCVWTRDLDGVVLVSIPERLVLTAAADHCPRAAYADECLGVYSGDLLHFRAETRAEFQGRTVSAVLADVQVARRHLESAPKISMAGAPVADLREIGTVPEVPEAALRIGMPFLSRLKDRDGRWKESIMSATAEVVAAWQADAGERGLVDMYGDPARGFAGGYLPADK